MDGDMMAVQHGIQVHAFVAAAALWAGHAATLPEVQEIMQHEMKIHKVASSLGSHSLRH